MTRFWNARQPLWTELASYFVFVCFGTVFFVLFFLLLLLLLLSVFLFQINGDAGHRFSCQEQRDPRRVRCEFRVADSSGRRRASSSKRDAGVTAKVDRGAVGGVSSCRRFCFVLRFLNPWPTQCRSGGWRRRRQGPPGGGRRSGRGARAAGGPPK